MKRALALFAVCATALGLAACGEKKETTTPAAQKHTITLLLDYLPNPDHVGIYAALANGDFDEAGLDVKVETPSDPAGVLKLLEAGRADIAISYEPELLIARDKGAQIVSVGAIAQAPLTSLMTLDRRVRDVTDLRGGRVGTAGIPYQSAYLRTILETASVPVDSVKETSVGFNLVPAMLSRRVDATLGAFWNVEGIQLERARRNPRIWRMDELGVPTYDELVLASTKDFVGEHGDDVRAFVQALARGYEAARADPQAATDALVQAAPDLDAGFALASVRASLPVFFPEDASKPWGFQVPTEWDRYGDWMYENGLLDRRPQAGAAAITNEFLAGQSG
ncbi:ABC transporter substrate-binding protein [Conexibacter sp. JD483]|uniref:ABC transporter substrate-binding protein n=1 Tax=unclassified Conexibacter TaxID=2627773 RepID=UPI00271DB0C9|nr:MULTISPECIES: ABC transporter substrate-binding protein [unclassified Conexibacter]MDO8186171.1 ABC transporter substrate-binding protein [Conexibacter sp. CPCC 205706]MDO8199661.1 ABC transporter substrate-binding protein [Conexibacter sp. CPCC 205762]MDR9371789.1 ABC transporter substrate-binding protein [Conexibacter sp. JD483]